MVVPLYDLLKYRRSHLRGTRWLSQAHLDLLDELAELPKPSTGSIGYFGFNGVAGGRYSEILTFLYDISYPAYYRHPDNDFYATGESVFSVK